MASPLKHSVSYPFSADRYWEIVSTEQYWHDLLEATNSSHGRLESFSSDGTTVTVKMLQGVPEDRLRRWSPRCVPATSRSHAR